MKRTRTTRGLRCRGPGAWALALFLLASPLAHADPAEWIARGERLYRQGDYRGALEGFQRASWERPQDPVLHYNIAVLAETLGRLDTAVEAYLAYLRWDLNAEDRETVRTRVFQLCGKLGSAAYRDQAFRNAVYWYEKADKLYPRTPAVQYNLGKVYEAMEDLDRAAAYVNEYRALCKPKARKEAVRWLVALRTRQAQSAFSQGRLEEARAALLEAYAWDPGDPGVLLDLARCEERLGLLDGARQRYTQFLDQAPAAQAGPEVRTALGRIYRIQAERSLREDDTAKAEALLLQGVDRIPDDRDLQHLLARTYLKTDRPALALGPLEAVCRLTPPESAGPVIRDLVEISLALADDAYRAQDYRTAERLLGTAQFWDPDSPVLAHGLAKVYDGQREHARAVQAYRRYLSLRPEASEREEIRAHMAYLCYLTGSERFRKGQYQEAQEAFEQALLLRPYDPALLYNLSLVLLKRGDTGAAIHFLERYMQYETDPSEVQRVRVEVASLRAQMADPAGPRKVATTAAAPAEAGPTAAPQDDQWLKRIETRRRAHSMLKRGRWADAASLYQQHLREFPADRNERSVREEMALAYREQGRSALLQGHTAHALGFLEKARESAPWEAASYLLEGEVHESRRNVDQSLALYRETLRVVPDPDVRKVVYRKVAGLLARDLQTALRNRDYEAALAKLVEMGPYLDDARKRDLNYQIAQVHSVLGRRSEALVYYGLHVQQAPGSIDAGGLADEIRRLGGAAEVLRALPEDPERVRALGLSAAGRGEHAEALFLLLATRGRLPAEDDVDRAILASFNALAPEVDPLLLLARSPDSPGGAQPLSAAEKDLWMDQGARRLDALQRQGLYEEGLRVIARLEESGSREDFSLLKAGMEERLGREDLAVTRLLRSLESGGAATEAGMPAAMDRLCDLLVRQAIRTFEQGAIDKARSLLEESDRLCPGRKDIPFNLGCVFFRQKQPHRALEAFSRYLDLAGDEESPRRIAVEATIDALRSQIAASASVRYGEQGASVDLVFDPSWTLGALLDSGRGAPGDAPDARALLDQVLLAPYLEHSSASP